MKTLYLISQMKKEGKNRNREKNKKKKRKKKNRKRRKRKGKKIVLLLKFTFCFICCPLEKGLVSEQRKIRMTKEQSEKIDPELSHSVERIIVTIPLPDLESRFLFDFMYL